MKFSCENCGTRYTLSDEKVKNRILKIRCKVCEHVIVVRDNQASTQAAPASGAGGREVEWYVSRQGGTPDGPMPLERLTARIASGRLDGNDMVWNQSMANWSRADEALAEHFMLKAPKATPPPLLPARPPSLPKPGVSAPKPLLPKAKATAPKPLLPKAPAPPAPPAAEAAPPVPKVPTPPVETDATQAMEPDFNSLFSDVFEDAEAQGAAVGSTDTAVALPGADTLLAPAATASALAAMESGNDTTALPELSPATDWTGLIKESVEAPAIPEAEPAEPEVAAEESIDRAPLPPPEPIDPAAAGSAAAAALDLDAPADADDAEPAAAGLSAAQSAIVEDAFFSDAHPATSGDYPAASGDYPAEEESKSRMPLFIVLAVLLLGGGIALGVMIAGGQGDGDGDGPVSTASAAPATEAPATEAPATEAPPTAPPSEAPVSTAASDAPSSEAPASTAPATEAPASVASKAPATRKPKVAAPKSRPKAPKSKAPPTAGRFAALNGKKPKAAAVPSASVKTEAPIDLPETLGSSQITSVIKRYKRGLHGCYQRQLKRDASMRKASLKLAFNIERSGRTSNIKIDRKYNGTELKNCLTRLVRRWRFPQFTGAAIPVEYPLFFQASL